MSSVSYLPTRPYTPTADQAATVAALDALSDHPRWVVDAAAVDGDATEACANDWAHGPGTVTGLPGAPGASPDGMCGPCAVAYVQLAHRDPHWDGATISLDVTRAGEEMAAICTVECWTPTPCPTCGDGMAPRGRSVAPEAHQSDCCEEARYKPANPRHLWSEHDEVRQIHDPEGWAAHVGSCAPCRGEEE